MNTKRSMSLVICSLMIFGCTGPYPDRHVNYNVRDINGNEFGRIRVVPGAVRTVCIQGDPTQPETTLIVKPLEAKLAAKGYKIVPTPDEAAHTIHLHINVFGTELKPVSPKSTPIVNAAVVGNTASMPAVGTTAGAAAGLAGSVLASALRRGPSGPKGPTFYAEVDVRISDPVSGEQHTPRGDALPLHFDPQKNSKLYQAVEQQAADGVATKIAALMP